MKIDTFVKSRIADLYGVSPQMIGDYGMSPFRVAQEALKRAIKDIRINKVGGRVKSLAGKAD